ncbi:MAG: hypothetical protein ONB16_05485 [candidate division KSB1 bacterium]|nr:hypothetical protein [candidate division KSB1 bacterium]MDZ7342681.1 hypothetical protein [candidate division KSB1 bacterium]
MAYFYIDDGFPESEDYENNYIFFDGKNQECLQKMIQLAQALAKSPSHLRKKVLEKFLTDQGCSDPGQAVLANS